MYDRAGTSLDDSVFILLTRLLHNPFSGTLFQEDVFEQDKQNYMLLTCTQTEVRNTLEKNNLYAGIHVYEDFVYQVRVNYG